MITIKHSGSLNKAERFLKKMSKRDYVATLRRYGEMGVAALEEATPRDTGITANSWSYKLEKGKDGYTLYWKNSSTNDGSHIAILIQHGHMTGAGYYVRGIDYINPALKKVFNDMANALWEEVQTA